MAKDSEGKQKEVVIKSICSYNGHNIKPNSSVDISFKFKYDELVNYIRLVQLLNENINIVVKIGDEKPKKLGIFRLKEIKIDDDGEAVIKFNSSLDYVEADNLNGLVNEILKVAFKASIEDKGEE